MELDLKTNKRNLQPIYDLIVSSFSKNKLDEMKTFSFEFIEEMRTTKTLSYRFNEQVKKIKNKDKLLMFITNLHMQDSSQTAGLSKPWKSYD